MAILLEEILSDYPIRITPLIGSVTVACLLFELSVSGIYAGISKHLGFIKYKLTN